MKCTSKCIVVFNTLNFTLSIIVQFSSLFNYKIKPSTKHSQLPPKLPSGAFRSSVFLRPLIITFCSNFQESNLCVRPSLLLFELYNENIYEGPCIIISFRRANCVTGIATYILTSRDLIFVIT